MEDTTPSHSSLRIVTRLDHLDFLMKYLERKQEVERRGITISTISSYGGEKVEEKNRLPLDLALKDVQFKGSLLDRVSSLEHRLSQLCFDMESSSSTQTSGGNSSSSQGSKGESSCSFPTFNNTNTIPSIRNRPISQPHSHFEPEIEETHNRDQPKGEHSNIPKKQLRKNIKSNKNERYHKNGKKKAAPSWPHFKLLGC